MRKRLRPAWPDDELRALCSERHVYTHWRDHALRVPMTTELCRWMLKENGWTSAADLACGEGYMLKNCGAKDMTFGDVTRGWQLSGPIEQTIHDVSEHDLLICTEVLEHMDDPDHFLELARDKFKGIVVSTPVGSWEDDTPGHYWAWDGIEIEDMLASSGWTVKVRTGLDFEDPGLPHTFGIWGAT